MLGQMTTLIHSVVNQTDIRRRNLNYTSINNRNIKTLDNKSNNNYDSSKVSRSDLYSKDDYSRMNPKMNDTQNIKIDPTRLSKNK